MGQRRSMEFAVKYGTQQEYIPYTQSASMYLPGLAVYDKPSADADQGIPSKAGERIFPSLSSSTVL
jgi:hypothetical protein